MHLLVSSLLLLLVSRRVLDFHVLRGPCAARDMRAVRDMGAARAPRAVRDMGATLV